MWLTNLPGVEGFSLKLPGFLSGSGRFQSDESRSTGREGDRLLLTRCKQLPWWRPASRDGDGLLIAMWLIFRAIAALQGSPGCRASNSSLKDPKSWRCLFPLRVSFSPLTSALHPSLMKPSGSVFQGEPGEVGQKGFPGLPVSPSLNLPKVFSWCDYQTHVSTSACRGSRGAWGRKERRVTEENPAHWSEPKTQNNQ